MGLEEFQIQFIKYAPAARDFVISVTVDNWDPRI